MGVGLFNPHEAARVGARYIREHMAADALNTVSEPIWRSGFRTTWCAPPVSDFEAPAPYKGLVAVTWQQSDPRQEAWIAQALPVAEQHSWLTIWRAIEEVHRRAGADKALGIVGLEHLPRERVLSVAFGPLAAV